MLNYYARTRQIGDLFEAAGEEVSDTLLCLAALNGLPKVYLTHAIVLTTGSDTDKKVKGLEFSKMFAVLQQAEQTIKYTAEDEDLVFWW